MAQAQKVGSKKKLQRSSRMKSRNESMRPAKVKRAREHHLKNALRSCGESFAKKLANYYLENFNAPKKVQRRR